MITEIGKQIELNKGNLGRLRQGRGLAVVVNGLLPERGKLESTLGQEGSLRRSRGVYYRVMRNGWL